MSTTTAARTSTGTVKIGRWKYPARRDHFATDTPATTRNTKRDGTGEWVDVLEHKVLDSFVADAPAAAYADTAPAIPGFIDEEPSNFDYDDLRTAYAVIFDDFGVSYEDLVDATGCSIGRVKSLVSHLVGTGLVVSDTITDVGGARSHVIQSLETYDSITRSQAMANFAAAVPADVTVRATSTHGGRAGAQVRKPGRSSWKIGDACPQGHILTADNLYAMASGRRQCRDCRRGYPSNGATA